MIHNQHRTNPMSKIALLVPGALLVALTLSSAGHDHDGSSALTALKGFPSTASWYQDDIAPWVDRIVARHGKEEWQCVVLTHELHGHMGIFNVLGAKMGLRAREVLKSAREGLQVQSFAGLTTPLSCFNDGLQVATGATLGRGTIHVDIASPRPEARISSATATCDLSVKPDVMRRIKHDIDSLSSSLGYGSPSYFAAVRQLSMRCWLELDRGVIFDETIDEPHKDGR